MALRAVHAALLALQQQVPGRGQQHLQQLLALL